MGGAGYVGGYLALRCAATMNGQDYIKDENYFLLPLVMDKLTDYARNYFLLTSMFAYDFT